VSRRSPAGGFVASPASTVGLASCTRRTTAIDSSFKFAISNRFRDSLGVNVWTQGQVSLLHEANLTRASTGASLVAGGLDGSTPVIFHADGSALTRVTNTGTTNAVTWGGSGVILDLATSATGYYVASSGGIYSGSMAGGAGTKQWNLDSVTTTSVKLGWVKQRLVAGVNNSIYELTGPATAPSALPAPLYTHPSPSWVWTAIVAGPNAIYASGHAGGSSSVVEFTLTSTGAMPTLSSAITVAELPQGEIVTSLFSYLGTYLVLGTNKGVRVATMDSGGNITYGPLTIELPAGAGSVRAMVGKDRFVYCGASTALPDGKSGLFRVDLSAQDNGRFPYATDLQAGDVGRVSSAALLGDQVCFTLDTKGLYQEHPTNLVASGYLRTGRIRYRTLELKQFKYIAVRTDPLVGSVGISVLDSQDAEFQVATVTDKGEANHPDSALPGQLGGQEAISVKFTLTRDLSPTLGPVFRSYQIKALPGTRRQRQLTIPLLCYDHESSATGQRFGYLGYARERLEKLEGLEDTGDAVLYQDFTAGTTYARLVVIDQIQHLQAFPPDQGRGLGGKLVVVLRTLD
jgi:hypothetical protein